MELERHLPNIRAHGLGLAAISYDSVAILKNFSDRQHITFPLLSDPGSKIIRAFGILNETVPRDSRGYGIPYPGTYLLDPSGRVVAKFFENDYKQRTPALEMLEETGAVLGIPRTTVDAEQLRLFSSASDEIVQPYKKVALFLDVRLASNMHVYAPGVKGYIPIDWKMTATPVARFYPARYPASQMLRLAVIKETVPVYRGHFRLAEDVVFGSKAGVKPLVNAHHDLTLTGSLRYQACDDHQCYLPQTIPLRWTFHYQGLDHQRVPPGIQHRGKSH